MEIRRTKIIFSLESRRRQKEHMTEKLLRGWLLVSTEYCMISLIYVGVGGILENWSEGVVKKKHRV